MAYTILLLFLFLLFFILFFLYLNDFYKNNSLEKFSVPTCHTACYNKSDDFDEWCRFSYPLSSIPGGNSINNVGAQYVLEGSVGGCSNKNEACAVCNTNHIEEVSKLSPANNNLNYNIFTDCQLLQSTIAFQNDCNTKMQSQGLSITPKPVVAEIMGYDCLPGYGRGKCISPNDVLEENDSNSNIKSSITFKNKSIF
jgi:hypothetical protein